MRWHVISNDTGEVLAVYGAALGREAEEKARALREQFPFAGIHHEELIYADDNRPHVGQSISVLSRY